MAVLVFPRSAGKALAEMRARGLTVDEPVPSVVVRDRLARRYGLPAQALDVGILQVSAGVDDRFVEVFLLEVGADTDLVALAEQERLQRNESHVALDVRSPSEVVLAGLRSILLDQAALVADGGGYNNFEDCTVLYFRDPDRTGRRLEIRARGYWPGVLAGHSPSSAVDDVDDVAKRLLTLMTGAWATQAIAVAAELGLADELTTVRATPVEELATRLAVSRDGLTRLLRYLASLGLVERRGDAYVLTPLGEPLRKVARHSLRPLALMYGRPFYDSFAMLGHSVRTGEDGFAEMFGEGHFDHFAARPGLAEMFDASMAASSSMLEVAAEAADFAGARVVVDVGGGNGELLSQVLTRRPHVLGVLVEREHVLKRAEQRLLRAGLAGRCEFVAGDFTEFVPPGGDVYLLSRVLHDWDDERCLTILRRCAASMDAGGRLLIVERLLSENGRPSLADAWDLHMLCNVGGRERTASHYGQLLDAAGFVLTEVSGLPLDGSLLHARRTTAPNGARA
ncbi:methyltransferase [Lentzea sp. NPDC058436]|uniref:methyltransferase n=1 Tax=Lentzea sp. NPDC058436 TaxID=3346499 RepID=UPI003667D303